MPDISKFKSGLSENAFRAAYDDALKKEGGTFNFNDFKNAWGSYSSPLSKTNATDTKNSEVIDKMSTIQNFSSSVKSYTTGGSRIEPSAIIETVSDVIKGFFSKGSTVTGGVKNIIDKS
jgi:phage-related protein